MAVNAGFAKKATAVYSPAVETAMALSEFTHGWDVEATDLRDRLGALNHRVYSAQLWSDRRSPINKVIVIFHEHRNGKSIWPIRFLEVGDLSMEMVKKVADKEIDSVYALDLAA
jgi:hypothetical protein